MALEQLERSGGQSREAFFVGNGALIALHSAFYVSESRRIEYPGQRQK